MTTVRPGAEYFLQPDRASQRRYEAMRAYFVDGMPASEVAAQFGYSVPSVHQLATLLRSGKLVLFAEGRPGPKVPGKAAKSLRTRVLELRAQGRPVTEISTALTRVGLPVSAQTVWQILDTEGMPRLPRREEDRRDLRAAPSMAEPVRLAGWPRGPVEVPCPNAGLLLLLPGMADLGLNELVGAAGYPSTRGISAWQSVGALLLAKCGGWERRRHAGSLAADTGLALALGLTALPGLHDLVAYSWRTHHESNRKLLAGLVGALRPLGLAAGDTGFNCDFHPFRGDGAHGGRPAHHPGGAVGAAFYAQDHASGEIVYVNAEVGRADKAKEVIEFADYWRDATGADPGLLVFDAQMTKYRVLDELAACGLSWLSVRQRGKAELARLAALPASAWRPLSVPGAGRSRRAWLHEDTIRLKGITPQVRQIAFIRSPGAQPVLLITNDRVRTAEDLFTRHRERLATAERPGASLDGFRLAAPSGVPLNTGLDTALTVVADSLYRLLARKISRYEMATPGRLMRHFLAASGNLHITERSVTCTLDPHGHHLSALDAGLAELKCPIPWWEGRTLRYRFGPP